MRRLPFSSEWASFLRVVECGFNVGPSLCPRVNSAVAGVSLLSVQKVLATPQVDLMPIEQRCVLLRLLCVVGKPGIHGCPIS